MDLECKTVDVKELLMPVCKKCRHNKGVIPSERSGYYCTICNNKVDKEDIVNHPPHYTSHPSGIECIQVTEHCNFNIGNAIKYLWRHEGKNGIEDLKKAAWYINREIQRLEANKQKPA